MKKSTKRAARLASLGLCAAMLLTACGGSASGSVATGETGSTSSGTTAAAPTGGKDGVLDVGYNAAIDSLTPFRSNTGQNAPYMTQLYESLAVYDSNKELQPWVATDWSTSDNGFTYDVNIREGIKDSAGNDITAADIVWFIEESKAQALKPVFGKVESVTQTGDYSFQVKMTQNIVGTFETLLKHTFVISKAAYEASEDGFATSAITTSPYQVTDFVASSSLTFELRDDYWQDIENMPECVRPAVDKLTYHIITEASQQGIALETGTVDMVIDMPASTGIQFVDNENYNVELTDNVQGWEMFFSGADNRPVANDVKLRQAICYAIDPQGLITGYFSGYGEAMHDVCPPTAIGYNAKWDEEEYYPYDPEMAKQLLEESDYNGETLTLFATNTSQRMCEIIQSYLLAVGINCELNLVDMALYTASRLDGTQYDMTINTISATYLADHWSVRYDPAAYATGDATSRHDETLAELLYTAWTPDGYTEENIDAVHYYLKDNAIAYGMCNPKVFTIWRTDIGVENEVKELAGYIAPAASTYSGL